MKVPHFFAMEMGKVMVILIIKYLNCVHISSSCIPKLVNGGIMVRLMFVERVRIYLPKSATAKLDL